MSFTSQMTLYHFFISSHSESKLHRRRAQALEDGVHASAGSGAREGVPLQPVPDAQAQGGDRAHALSLGKAD